MLKKEKTVLVDKLKKRLGTAKSIFLADFTGINVKDVNALRRAFQKASIEYMVAKNTMIKRAVADTPLKPLEPYLNGPTALVIVDNEGVEAAKIITKFAEDHQSFAVKIGVMSEKFIQPGQVKNIARLPTKEVLVARLLGTLNAPIANLVFVLNGTLSQVVRVLDQVSKTKQPEKN